jgi:hypothetical protein
MLGLMLSDLNCAKTKASSDRLELPNSYFAQIEVLDIDD